MTRKSRALAAALALLGSATAAAAQAPSAPAPATAEAARVHYRTVEVDGIKIFYREAGDPARPTILLLHGFPSSSNEFRTLIPMLGSRFHVVAPDYPGAGFSEAPGADRFQPTFGSLAGLIGRFTEVAKLGKFIVYMHDFGGPVGFRIAVARPDRVVGLVIQNANAYERGIAPDILKDMKARADGPLDAQARAGVEQTLSAEGTKFQYLTGVREQSDIDPAGYRLDSSIQAMPEPHRIQGALLVDYYDNVRQYPAWQRYLKEHQPKTLIVWGKNDPIFTEAGARAYLDDLPRAQLHLYDTGHFALEEEAPGIAREIVRAFGDAPR